MDTREKYLRAKIRAHERVANERWRAHLREHDRERQLLDAARDEINLRLREMNEVRAQIGQERGLYATKDALVALEHAMGAQMGARDDAVTAVERAMTAQMITADDAIRNRLNSVENLLANYNGRLAAIGATFLVLTVAINVFLHFV